MIPSPYMRWRKIDVDFIEERFSEKNSIFFYIFTTKPLIMSRKMMIDDRFAMISLEIPIQQK